MEVSSDAISSAAWEAVGPSNIGGRITALVIDPADTNTIVLGAAAGGIFKSTDGGASWTPKTDQWKSLSVGAMAMDYNNPNIIYCGTGEANISTDSYAGFGMLKSTDKGETWFMSGLENSRHIGEIKVHPSNSNLVFAAVSGGLYSQKSPIEEFIVRPMQEQAGRKFFMFPTPLPQLMWKLTLTMST
ncbi:hypothetical protein MASR1M107_28350 [Ignavibacteriales bacterium]